MNSHDFVILCESLGGVSKKQQILKKSGLRLTLS